MKKLLTFTSAALLASSVAFASESASDFYVKAGLGADYSNTKVKSDGKTGKIHKFAPVYMLGLGYNITSDLRTDLTFDYSTVKEKKKFNGGLKQTVFKAMLNAEYDVFEIASDTKFYGTLGAGFASVKYKGAFKGKKTKFAWAIGAGVNGKITETIGWDLGYKFTDILKIKKDGSTFDPQSHSLMFGVKFGL